MAVLPGENLDSLRLISYFLTHWAMVLDLLTHLSQSNRYRCTHPDLLGFILLQSAACLYFVYVHATCIISIECFRDSRTQCQKFWDRLQDLVWI